MAAKGMTQAEVVAEISETEDIPKSVVRQVLERDFAIMCRELKTKGKKLAGPGVFSIPYHGVKLENKLVPKRKARMGRNPATGEEIKIPAKPAHNKVKARVLSKVKTEVGVK